MTPENTAAATGAAKYPRLYRWAGYFTSVCMVLILLIQALSFVTLPSCDDNGLQETIRDIFKEQGAVVDRISDIKQVSEEKGRETCAARVEAAGETADVTYGVFWDGWTKKVQIGAVTVLSAAGAASPGK